MLGSIIEVSITHKKVEKLLPEQNFSKTSSLLSQVMDTSLDKFYAKVYKLGRRIPEDILGKIAVAVVSALHYLYSQLKVIHRDVKPSNILINKKGEVKMCDFGISGYLVDSVAKTIDAGCKPYMAVSRFQ